MRRRRPWLRQPHDVLPVRHTASRGGFRRVRRHRGGPAIRCRLVGSGGAAAWRRTAVRPAAAGIDLEGCCARSRRRGHGPLYRVAKYPRRGTNACGPAVGEGSDGDRMGEIGQESQLVNAQLPTANSQMEIVTLAAVRGRPSGPRFGTLVHASLAAVPLDADEVTSNQIVAVQGRIVGRTIRGSGIGAAGGQNGVESRSAGGRAARCGAWRAPPGNADHHRARRAVDRGERRSRVRNANRDSW